MRLTKYLLPEPYLLRFADREATTAVAQQNGSSYALGHVVTTAEHPNCRTRRAGFCQAAKELSNGQVNLRFFPTLSIGGLSSRCCQGSSRYA